MEEEHLSACRELKAIVIGYIAVCKVFRDEDKNWHCTLTALSLFQNIFDEKSGFKWTLEASACCGRLSTILKAHDDPEVSLTAANLQYEILKQATNSHLSQYGPECFYVCDNLAAIWLEDAPEHALEFCRRAMDIRLELANAGIKTYMRQKTIHSFVPAVLLPLRETFERLISVQIHSRCCTPEEMVAEDEKYIQAIEAIEYRESIGTGSGIENK